MTFELPALPYAMDALQPHISQETLEYHYGKHHKAYVEKLNGLVPGTKFADMTLEEIIKKSDGGIFNNAAQVWNHTFYWNCLSPMGGGQPGSDELAGKIEQDFGSFDEFKKLFTDAALTQFGSGWAWLVAKRDGKLEVVKTSNAGNPMTDDLTPLLTCDVWEHAYYIDRRNARPVYVDHFWDLVNWDFVADNLKNA